MKTLRLFSMLMLLMTASSMAAQDRYIYADPVTIEAGGEAEIVVRMDLDTEEAIGQFGFVMKMPEGITTTYTQSRYVKRSVTMTAELEGEEDYSVIQAFLDSEMNLSVMWGWESASESALKNTHGELLRVAVKSSLEEALTFTPELSQVYVISDHGEDIVKDGKLVRDLSNTVYIDETEATVGKDVTLSVKLRNTMPVEGFAFDLILPLNMPFAEDAEGKPIVSLSEERSTAARMNTFEVLKLGNYLNSAVRVVAASTNGSAIEPGDGEVCTVRVHIPNGFDTGKYQLTLQNISLSDPEAVSHDLEEMRSAIIVRAYDRGDANGDGNVTVADLTAIAHHVLGNPPTGFNAEAADANQDGQVNVADYTAVAHLLLYGNIEGPAKARQVKSLDEALTEAEENTLYLDPVTAVVGEEIVLPVKMRNSVEAEGFQFSLRLPEGVSVVCDAEGFPVVSLSGDRTDERRTNTFASVLKADGTLTVMAASTIGFTISGSDGEVCSVLVRIGEDMAYGDYELQLSDISISDIHAKSHDVALMTATLTVGESTGIEDLSSLTSHPSSHSYDLQGRQAINGKGLIIRDGKKFIRH